jgi:SAM-dependent methyltransferase
MSYHKFAYVYDRLMEDAPYDQWIEFIERVTAEYGHSIGRIVDLGCGTGAISIPLAQKGYQVTGIDLSADMLSIANEKARSLHLNINLVEQDITELSLPEEMDTIVCFCDSLNYVIEEQHIRTVFKRVYNQLRPGGLFLFDCHTLYKLEHVFGENTFGSNDEDLSFLWNCTYDQAQHIVEHDLSFFLRENDGRYQRFDEQHTQKGYSKVELTSWLQKVGFELKEVTADFSVEAPQEESERLFFVLQKKNDD